MFVQKTVFISYRRTNSYAARAVYQALTTHGFDVFLDYEAIDAGSFEQIILGQIAARAHFIIILTPTALERCHQPGDWLRREIEHAIDLKRNIVPLMFEHFSFKDAASELIGKLALLPRYNGLDVPPAYFEAAMERLRTRFLSKPLDVIMHPAPAPEITPLFTRKVELSSDPERTRPELSADDLLARGNQAYLEGDYDSALADYDWAIQLNPGLAVAYNNRGVARYYRGELNKAIADYNAAVLVNPRYAAPFMNRGIVRTALNDLDGALVDLTEAIRLNPAYALAYLNRGVTWRLKQNLERANRDYRRYLELGGTQAEKVRGWIRANEAQMQPRQKFA
jgi:tetratricopeptide (TPR) repeat protein